MTDFSTSTDFIGMLHVPVNTILSSPPEWRKAMKLPAVIGKDWTICQEMEQMMADVPTSGATEFPSLDYGSGVVSELETYAAKLSFTGFLEDRMLHEAELYSRYGPNAVMLENIAAPYFVRGQQPTVIFAVMSLMTKRLRSAYLEGRFGIQILAFSDNLAMDIAIRYGFEFIRAESVLFAGVRPEGYTPNYGNLAKLYMTRSRMIADLQVDVEVPLVFVDLQKKHTIFDNGLKFLGTWLDNILFQKLEGVVITGDITGCPVAEQDLIQTRKAIQRIADKTQKLFGTSYAPPLIIGSGVSINNIDICKRYADSVIVGSSLKRGGYWECELDEEQLKKFAELWHAASKVKE